MEARLEFAIRAVEQAGEVAMRYFRAGTTIEFKQDDSPVTRADRDTEACIRELLAEEFPGEQILGEEQGGDDSPDRWVIDPIDGTKSFIRGVPLFATLLSYERAGEPVVAALRLPALNQTFWASRGAGAQMDGVPVHVSSETSLNRAFVAHGSINSLTAHGFMSGIERLVGDAYALRGWGDAYGYTLVASGYAEAFVDPIVERYDISAPALIVQEAGGRVTQLDGTEGIGRNALASNGLLHDEVLERFRA